MPLHVRLEDKVHVWLTGIPEFILLTHLLSLLMKVSKLCDLDEERNSVTSVSWSSKVRRGNNVAIVYPLIPSFFVLIGTVFGCGYTQGVCPFMGCGQY